MPLTDEELKRILKYDFSAGTEEFREQLLARCLQIIDGVTSETVPEESFVDGSESS